MSAGLGYLEKSARSRASSRNRGRPLFLCCMSTHASSFPLLLHLEQGLWAAERRLLAYGAHHCTCLPIPDCSAATGSSCCPNVRCAALAAHVGNEAEERTG